MSCILSGNYNDNDRILIDKLVEYLVKNDLLISDLRECVTENYVNINEVQRDFINDIFDNITYVDGEYLERLYCHYKAKERDQKISSLINKNNLE